MRWETSCFVLWTRRAVLTKEEQKQMKEKVGGGESGSEDWRCTALLSPLGAHGRPPCRLGQPGDGGAAAPKWPQQDSRRHRHVNELGVGKRLNADHVDFP